jgi:hypothetical protein
MCEFRADQESDGRIQCLFARINPNDCFNTVLGNGLLGAGIDVSFRGITHDGIEIAVRCSGGRPLAMNSEGYGIYFMPRKFTAVPVVAPAVSGCCFLLTNFAFSPFTHLGEPPHHPPSHSLTLESDGHQIELEISPLDDYVKQIVRLQQSRRILPTAHLSIKRIDESKPVPTNWPFLTATRICKLLSVAAGTVVEWVLADVSESGTARSYRVHAARETKPFCSLPCLPIKELGYEGNTRVLKTFLQTGLNGWSQWEKNGGIDSRTINGLMGAFIDARLETDYLEGRAIKTAVTLEILKGIFEDECRRNEWEKMLSPETQKKVKTSISKALKQECFNSEIRKTVSEILGELSRPRLRPLVMFMLRRLRLIENETSINAVVAIRNSLVHTGRFLSTSNPDKARQLEIIDAENEYYVLQGFVDRLMLRLVGYSGLYIDYSKRCGVDRSGFLIQELPIDGEIE